MLEFAATVFVTFLVIIDPIGMLPLFVALTYRQPKERRRIATRSIAVAAITLVAGPGAMTSIILLMGRAGGDFPLQAVVIAMALFVLGLCLIAFLFAVPLMDRLGVTGINVVGRIFGVVLAAGRRPSDHRHELALGIAVAIDVPLGGLDRPVTCQQLNVPERAADLVDEPGCPGDERPPPRMG
jgi:small neutral amino acid transporter SnatA (MarC family)